MRESNPKAGGGSQWTDSGYRQTPRWMEMVGALVDWSKLTQRRGVREEEDRMAKNLKPQGEQMESW